jgi:hypothetical protein
MLKFPSNQIFKVAPAGTVMPPVTSPVTYMFASPVVCPEGRATVIPLTDEYEPWEGEAVVPAVIVAGAGPEAVTAHVGAVTGGMVSVTLLSIVPLILFPPATEPPFVSKLP